MIDSLHGEVLSVGLDHVVIECGGVGYRATAAPNLLQTLRRGETVRVLTAFVVREESQTLYAFDSADSRELFGIVQTVTGIGPRLAMAMIAVLSPAELAAAVTAGDVKTLQRIPGVGKRMAERMVVELKTKVAKFVQVGADQEGVLDLAVPAVSAAAQKVAQALIGLGFPEAQAEKSAAAAVKAVGEQAGESELLRAALAAVNK